MHRVNHRIEFKNRKQILISRDVVPLTINSYRLFDNLKAGIDHTTKRKVPLF